MIYVRRLGAMTSPVVVCDICKQAIVDVGSGVAVYPAGKQDGELTGLFYVHKGECQAAAIELLKANAESADCTDLGEHLRLLVAGLGAVVDLPPAETTPKILE
jgi:hypothetical protein